MNMYTTNLGLDKDGAVAIEELEGSYKLALDQATHEHGCRCPPPCTDGHLPEPRLEREAPGIAATTTTDHLVHGDMFVEQTTAQLVLIRYRMLGGSCLPGDSGVANTDGMNWAPSPIWCRFNDDDAWIRIGTRNNLLTEHV